MSGPKVMRIVTREEILEICRGQLARVDAALEHWTRIGRRNGCVDDAAVTQAIRRRDVLAQLIATDRFLDLQKQAPIEEAFLRDDIQRRLAAVAAEQGARRSRERGERETAATLLRTLRASGQPLDPSLERRLARGEAAALAAGFDALAAAATPTSSTELATRLREGEPSQTLADWVAKQPDAPVNGAITRLDQRIAELAQLLPEELLAGWRVRLEEAAEAAPAPRRGLLLDALEIETGRALTEARRRTTALADLELLLAEAKAADLDTAAWLTASAEADSRALAAFSTEVAAAIAQHRARTAAAARRTAVLQGLSALGYEVAEGMATGLAQDGRLVLRSATRPDYGVEVGVSGERMQVRPVAFETDGVGPSATRDRDAEAIWCGNVAELRERLAAAGGDLVIVKALPVGATPLKRIAVANTGHTRGATAPSLRERTVR